MRDVGRDLAHAARGLWRAKGLTTAAVVTLALGIAGTTVMLALIQGVLLRPLPVRDQDRLIVAWKVVPASGSANYPFGSDEIEAVGRASRLVERVAGVTRNGVGREVVVDAGVSSYANVGLVTGGFFDVLGARPLLGRAFTTAHDVEGAESVVAISAGYWHRRYGGSRHVIGRQVVIGERAFTIAAVMPSDLVIHAGVEVWRPTMSVPTDGPFGDAARREVNLVGRLRPGVTLAQASAEITALAERLDRDTPQGVPRGLVPVVRSFADVVVGEVRLTLVALLGAVGLVLLVACANVATLLLMRGESRRAELALRAALGARASHLMRHVLAESILVATAAGVAGVALSVWSLPVLVAVAPEGLPRVDGIRIDATVILLSVAVVLVAALAAGAVPAAAALRADLLSPLRAGGHSPVRNPALGGRRALVVAQVAVAVTVLAVAGLLIRSVLKLQAVDLGMAAERLVLLDLYVPPAKLADDRLHALFLDRAMAELEAIPAVSAATPVNITPFSDRGWDVPRVTAEGQDEPEAVANPSLDLEAVHPSYFQTLQVRIVRGRAFTPADRAHAPLVAIVSADAAARVWPGQSPLGKRLKLGGSSSREGWRTVVGVAADTRYRTIMGPRPTLYLPAAQFLTTASNMVVRTTTALEPLTSAVADRVRTIDPSVRLMRAAPFVEMLDRPLARPRFVAFLLGLFAAMSLGLSAVGLYAVVAAHVRQRDREIAVRLALGATTARVRRLVLAEAVRLAGTGALVGIAGATGAIWLIRGLLFEVAPLDPWTTAATALLLIATAALASYVPMRRAARLDPAAMLRSS